MATYSGVVNTWDTSFTSLWQRENGATTVSGAGTSASPAKFCNTAGLVLPSTAQSADNIGAANPNPSNVFVSNLPGTISSVGIELDGFHTGADPTIFDTEALLVGPTGAGLDFFSGAGNNTTDLSTGTYLFEDSAAPRRRSRPLGQVRTGQPATTQPTRLPPAPAAFTRCRARWITPLRTAARIPSIPTTAGQRALHGRESKRHVEPVFLPETHASGAGATGWCVDFVQNLPTVDVLVPSTALFAQGQANQALTVEIANNGPGQRAMPQAPIR